MSAFLSMLLLELQIYKYWIFSFLHTQLPNYLKDLSFHDVNINLPDIRPPLSFQDIGMKSERMEEEKDFSRQIEEIKLAWYEAFKLMQKYYESEVFKSFKIKYDASIWYQFKNPALIFPAEREMRFSTPNSRINFDYYPSPLAKLSFREMQNIK